MGVLAPRKLSLFSWICIGLAAALCWAGICYLVGLVLLLNLPEHLSPTHYVSGVTVLLFLIGLVALSRNLQRAWKRTGQISYRKYQSLLSHDPYLHDRR